MKEINGQFIMDCCAPDDPNRLDAPEQLVELLRTVGFLPLFSTAIPHFSVEEHVPDGRWWTWDVDDPWEWRHVLASHPEIAYGKFFDRKAGFIHKDWFPVFASYRRNGYDFDALCNDELAPHKWKSAMDQFSLDDNLIGKTLPASAIPDERLKADLQMRTYLIILDFAQKRSKKGLPYGMHHAVLGTPETKWGYDYVISAYDEGTDAAWERIKGHMNNLYPTADEKALWSLLGMRILSTHADLMEPAPTRKAKRVVVEKPAKPKYPDNLVSMIGGIQLPLSDDQVAGLNHVLASLKDREKRILKMRFEQGQAYKEIGIVFGISSGRIQQIASHAIRKLSNPARLSYIKYGLEGITEKRDDVKVIGDDFPVTLMELSTRNINILQREHIGTIGEVCDLIEEPAKLQRLRNLGKGCLGELLVALRRHGIEFEDDSIKSVAEALRQGQKVGIKRIQTPER